MIRRALGAAASLLPLFVAAPAPAASPHAHHHYQIGARASAAKGFARQLHFEAAGTGELDAPLAAVNAADLERLAEEISHWVDAAEAAGEADGESKRIRQDLAAMRALARSASAAAGALRARLDEWIAAGAAPDRAARGRVTEDARSLYWIFDEVLRAHKRAEAELGIPTPEEPPRAGSPDPDPDVMR